MTQAQAVPRNVKAEMVRAGLRQADLARPLGISQQGVSARLNGRVDFTITELEIVAETIGVPLAHLINAPARSSS